LGNTAPIAGSGATGRAVGVTAEAAGAAAAGLPLGAPHDNKDASRPTTAAIRNAIRSGFRTAEACIPPILPLKRMGVAARERHVRETGCHCRKVFTAKEVGQMADNADTPAHYQPDHTGMYELEFPAPQLSSQDGRGPVLIHALEGFSDAGHAIRLAAEHLKNTLDTELVASFAIDELLDYRSRRPLMTFKTDHFTQYDEPQLNLYALHDSVGTPFLLLAGLEPDLRWERFITAVRLLAERLGVRRIIGLGTIPMAVPHTRPITLTAHSNDKELIAEHTPWVGEVQVPGSVSNLLEFRMSKHGYEVVGFTVHVPHYLAQTPYPAAAEVLLAEVAKAGALQIPLEALDAAGAEVQEKVNAQVEASSEVAQVVTALERQYDAFVAAQENRSLLANDEDLPSGDELGAEFERFLRQEADKHRDDDAK
jgi:predicted ATP-grasp superfamily ATP-dependent carboligase